MLWTSNTILTVTADNRCNMSINTSCYIIETTPCPEAVVTTTWYAHNNLVFSKWRLSNCQLAKAVCDDWRIAEWICKCIYLGFKNEVFHLLTNTFINTFINLYTMYKLLKHPEHLATKQLGSLLTITCEELPNWQSIWKKF